MKKRKPKSPKERAFAAAARIGQLVDIAANRSMASDGPCSPEHEELNERDWAQMLRYARAIVAAMEGGK